MWAIQLPSTEEDTGTGREPRVREGSSHVLCDQKGEDQGPGRRQGPWVPGVVEAMRSSPHCPGTGPFYRAVTLLSVHIAPCLLLPVRVDRRPYSHKGRADEMGAGSKGPLLRGPPNLSWCLEPRKSSCPFCVKRNEKLQVYLSFLFFYLRK